MNRNVAIVLALVVGIGIGVLAGSRLMSPVTPVDAQPEATPVSFSSVPGAVGAEDVSGPYDVVEGWPQDLATLPGHEKWTWGGARGIFAESPNRVFLLGGGELPAIPRPQAKFYPELGPNVQFPVNGLPWRNANNAAPPGGGGSGQDPAKGMEIWQNTMPPRQLGVDSRWEHCIVVVNAEGKIIEEWTQWDHLFKRPHSIYISPYDAEKHVWVVDDHSHAIFKFTNDGKELVQTIGTPNVSGADGTHFNRPTFIAWLPDGTFYVADGYNGTRVAKFDASGKFLLDFGMPGERGGEETRPSYMNNVHGVAVDVETRRVFVNDRDNHRIQIFDENGKYLSEWSIAVRPSSLHFVQIGADRSVVAFDRNTHKMLKYDLDGHLLYAWGTVSDFPGTLWGVHGMATDQEGNLYVAEVDAGRFQKFRPRPGANPATLIGKPVYATWQ